MSASELELRSVYLKAEYISAEFDLAKKAFDEFKNDFIKSVAEREDGKKALFRKEDDKSIEDAVKEIIEDDLADLEPPKEIIAEKEFKTIYRKIMTIVHPDKISQLNDERIQEEYSALSSAANAAYKEGDWFSLLSICYKLNLKNISVNNEVIPWLKDFCEKKESDIDGMKKSFPWIWSNANENLKQILINKFIENLLKN